MQEHGVGTLRCVRLTDTYTMNSLHPWSNDKTEVKLAIYNPHLSVPTAARRCTTAVIIPLPSSKASPERWQAQSLDRTVWLYTDMDLCNMRYVYNILPPLLNT